MPTKRTRIGRHLRPDCPGWLWARLNDHDEPQGLSGWDHWMFECANDAELLPGWQRYGEILTARYAVIAPGRRLSLWWRFVAPEPRRRLGGRGTPAWECLAYAERFEYGLPAHWVGAFELRVWPSIAECCDPFDPHDPPTFESQAAYLKRHGLLLPGGEAARLKPADYRREVLPGQLWPEIAATEDA